MSGTSSKFKGFLRRRDKVVWKCVGEKIFLLNLINGDYYEINLTGEIIWQLCDGENDLESVLSLAARKLKMPSPKVAADTHAFVNDLKKNGLIEIVSKPTAAVAWR